SVDGCRCTSFSAYLATLPRGYTVSHPRSPLPPCSTHPEAPDEARSPWTSRTVAVVEQALDGLGIGRQQQVQDRERAVVGHAAGADVEGGRANPSAPTVGSFARVDTC